LDFMAKMTHLSNRKQDRHEQPRRAGLL
jgi:hypothetical protein